LRSRRPRCKSWPLPGSPIVIGATGRVPTTHPGVTGRSAGRRCRAVRHG